MANDSSARPQPCSGLIPPPRGYMTRSRSGQTRRPCSVMSSPVLPMTVTWASGSAATRPRSKPAGCKFIGVILVLAGTWTGVGGSERGGCALSEVIVPLAHVIVRPEDVDDQGWQDRALCAQTDPEAFFPEKGGSTREAKRVCRSCEVRAECLDYALESDERFGIWGGMSERERRRLKRAAV